MDRLICEIYEAAVIAEKWPGVLDALGKHFHTKGALLFTLAGNNTCWLGGGAMADIMAELMAEGWMARNDRPGRVQARAHPGFVTELDVMSEQELLHDPVCEQFLRPRGCHAAAGTYVPGLAGDHVMLSVEGFADYHAAMAAVPALDTLRPHLARAIQLAGQFRLQMMRGQVEALQAIGAPACVVRADGVTLAANARFQDQLGKTFLNTGPHLRLADRCAQHRFMATIAQMRVNGLASCSIPVRADEGAVYVLHMLPIAGAASDIFARACALLVLAETRPCVRLSPQLLQQLFDFTPAEARIAVLVGTRGATLSRIAADAGLSINTAKSQIRSVFQKTGTERQADLVRLLAATCSVGLLVDAAVKATTT